MTFLGWAGACRGTTPVCTITLGSDVLVVWGRFTGVDPIIDEADASSIRSVGITPARC